jgi:hypothetical protein
MNFWVALADARKERFVLINVIGVLCRYLMRGKSGALATRNA